jgi:3',5'-cyclic AMP phosphodiesterase CpdA
MRKIIHLSDLHFGRTDPDLTPALLSFINQNNPDLIIISGDFTMRAKKEEYAEAKRFLENLTFPYISVPGNHDIPTYRFWERIIFPYKKYKKNINVNLEPTFIDNEIAVAGINTTHPLTGIEGTLSLRKLKRVIHEFEGLPDATIKMIFSHHPFNTPIDHPQEPFKSAGRALALLSKSKIDLLLSGHLHTNMRRLKDSVYRIAHAGPLIIHAGTAISTRLRGEPNSFNLININHPYVEIQRFEKEANENRFTNAETERFKKTLSGWDLVKD